MQKDDGFSHGYNCLSCQTTPLHRPLQGCYSGRDVTPGMEDLIQFGMKISALKKHRKNCECCHHHSLFQGHNVNANIVVPNCQ